jgi:hypothetical protein
VVTVTWIAPRDPVTPSRSSLKSEAGKVRPARNDGSPPPGARDSCAGGDVIDVDGTVSDVFIVGAAVGFGVTIGATGAAVGIRVPGGGVGLCEWCTWCLCVGPGSCCEWCEWCLCVGVDTGQAAAGAFVPQVIVVPFFTPVSKASTDPAFESRTVTSSKSAGSVGSLSSSRNARSESFSLACRTLGAHVGVRAALLLGLRGQALRWCFGIRLALLIREERPCRGALHLFECLRFAAELLLAIALSESANLLALA